MVYSLDILEQVECVSKQVDVLPSKNQALSEYCTHVS